VCCALCWILTPVHLDTCGVWIVESRVFSCLETPVNSWMDMSYINLSLASWSTAHPSFWHIERWNFKNGRVIIESLVFSCLEVPVDSWMDMPHVNVSPASWSTARLSFWYITHWNRLKMPELSLKVWFSVVRKFRWTAEWVNGHALRQFIRGQFKRSMSVILTYSTSKSIHKWLSYAAKNRFYPLTWGRRPAVNVRPSVKRRKLLFG
jgi:hypothetical protein